MEESPVLQRKALVGYISRIYVLNIKANTTV